MSRPPADPYLIPGRRVLRSKVGITSQKNLDRVERELVLNRIEEFVPAGVFDLDHLQAIHRQLFQDVYDWAGELRTVELAKGGNRFMPATLLGRAMGDIHRRLETADFLRGLDVQAFTAQAGTIIGDVNYVHPFREGNGRTQLLYLEQLADQAGHPIDLSWLDPQGWMEASRAAHGGDYAPMGAEILKALI